MVEASTIEALVGAPDEDNAKIWIPTYHGVRGNPVLFDRSLFEEIERVRGDMGCRRIIEAHPREVVEVPVNDPGILIDVDTPEDLRRIEAALDRGSLGVVARAHVRKSH